MPEKWVNLLTSFFATLVGVASFAALMIDGTPAGEEAQPGRQFTVTHSKSNCPSKCSEPEEIETEVTVTSRPPVSAGTPALLEKAIDNDAGAIVIRFILALLTGLTTAVTLGRLLRGLSKEEPPKQPPNLEPPPGPHAPAAY